MAKEVFVQVRDKRDKPGVVREITKTAYELRKSRYILLPSTEKKEVLSPSLPPAPPVNDNDDNGEEQIGTDAPSAGTESAAPEKKKPGRKSKINSSPSDEAGK